MHGFALMSLLSVAQAELPTSAFNSTVASLSALGSER